METIVEISGLGKSFPQKQGQPVTILRDVNLTIGAGQTLCVMGESGCGKTTLGKIIAGLSDYTTGSYRFCGKEVSQLKGKEWDAFRESVQLIHQNPYESLNPASMVFDIIANPIRRHRKITKIPELYEEVTRLLKLVGLTPVEDFVDKYPAHLSGGQRQRVSIARILAMNPKLIVVDEATSMIDTSLRISLLSTMKQIQQELGVAYFFDFQKHPEICEGSDPITAADILALQQRCKELGIELQANLQCLGHCRRILTRKEHMHLSESEMFWSLCTTSQDALNLIDDMFSEYLPLFESQWVNICFDEPYDIGKGKSAPLGKDGSVLYVEFLNKVHDLAAKYGKKIMFFGDVIVRHPEYLPTLPKDVRYLDWCYDPKPYFGTPAVFDRYHLDYWVSPGSGNWNTLFPRLDGCLANVNQLLKEGFAANAGGMLFTDWNDHGGYTQPGAGYYGYGYAAAVAWAGEAQNREKADAYLDRILDLPGYSQAIQTLAKIYQIPPIWSKNRSQCVMALFDEPIFGQAIRGPEPPAGLKAYDLTLPEGVQTVLERHSQHPLRPYFSIPEAACVQIADLALQGKELAANLPLGPIRDQLLYQANAFLLMTDKLALSRKIIARFETEDLTVEDMVLLEEELRVLIQRYVHLQLDYIKTWMQVARVSEIDISLTYFAHIIERLDYLRDWISLQREDLCAGKEICRDFSNYQTAGYGTLPTY